MTWDGKSESGQKGGKFCGKTLLMLGSNVGAADMVRYARLHGARTIAVDYLPVDRSAAKQVADEHYEISTADLDALSSLITERGVDGVLAGISEFNLLGAMELCQRHGLPFYCTREQWDAVESKDQFRRLCERFGVPAPQTYFTGKAEAGLDWDAITYPAVLKPVDASSSKGVHICHSRADVEAFLEDAVSSSASGQIIIEEFCAGDEFTAHYTICGGHAALTCIDNRYPVAVHEGDVTTVPVARLYPCLYLDRYLELVNPQMISLCEGIGLSDAVLFVQGLYDAENDVIRVFEAGLRSAGEAPCRLTERLGGNNYLHLLVDHALSGSSDLDLSREDPRMGGKCCGVVSFVARGATVGTIEGLEEAVEAVPAVVAYESRYPVGTTTPDGDTLRQLMIRFVMIEPDRVSMERDVRYLNERVTVLDTEGNDMVIRMEPARVHGTK